MSIKPNLRFFRWVVISLVVVGITFGLPGLVLAAPKISVRSVEQLDEYTKVYVAPIRNDGRDIQRKVVERLKKAGFDTVDLMTEHLPFAAQGTGFVLSPEGHVLTCAHVVGHEPNVTLWIDGNRYVGRVTAVDTNLDVAMVLVEGNHQPLSPLGLATGGPYHLGQDVFVMGFPAADLLGSKPRLNKGTISSTVGVNDNPRQVQISVPVQPGNSGGPLLDEHGQVIGMVSSTINPSRMLLVEGNLPQNVNFALKSEFLLAFLHAANIALPGVSTNAAAASGGSDGLFDGIGRSLALVRAGIVDEQRLKERPLLCSCSYFTFQGDRFFRLRIVFTDVKKIAVVLSANLDESSMSSESKVLDAMFEHICDKFFPDKVNPFNPKKSKAGAH